MIDYKKVEQDIKNITCSRKYTCSCKAVIIKDYIKELVEELEEENKRLLDKFEEIKLPKFKDIIGLFKD